MTEERHSWEEAIEVSSIAEEYGYIREHKCVECGGDFETHMQSLIFNEDENPYDLLACLCKSCGMEKKFYFDISSFFGKSY